MTSDEALQRPSKWIEDGSLSTVYLWLWQQAHRAEGHSGFIVSREYWSSHYRTTFEINSSTTNLEKQQPLNK